MIDRQDIYFYIGLGVLCVMVVAAVIFFVKPTITPELPKISEPTMAGPDSEVIIPDIPFKQSSCYSFFPGPGS